MDWPHAREHYRIGYPTVARPRLLLDGKPHEVVDISEHGIRFRTGEEPPEPGAEVRGVVRFRSGEVITIRGKVLRVQQGEAAAFLEEGVPYRVIVEEQRFLLDRHRNLAL